MFLVVIFIVYLVLFVYVHQILYFDFFYLEILYFDFFYLEILYFDFFYLDLLCVIFVDINLFLLDFWCLLSIGPLLCHFLLTFCVILYFDFFYLDLLCVIFSWTLIYLFLLDLSQFQRPRVKVNSHLINNPHCKLTDDHRCISRYSNTTSLLHRITLTFKIFRLQADVSRLTRDLLI